MPNYFEGNLNGEGLAFGIVVSRFNEFITGKLLNGALDALKRHGVKDEHVSVVWVPGAFEIPLIADRLAVTHQYHAIICLGAIIRGSTPHFDYIASELSKGIASVTLKTGLPVIYGVITADTLEQAIERAGSKMGNKGWDASVTAIEMANLISTMKAITSSYNHEPI
jgi:6,7-dimethyl-8-ribityllumazine synthase